MTPSKRTARRGEQFDFYIDLLGHDILNSNQAQVNSLHHQGVRTLASQLHPTALASDGLIEAIELPETQFGLAVQWHPEELPEHEVMRRLFQAFVQSCQSNNSV